MWRRHMHTATRNIPRPQAGHKARRTNRAYYTKLLGSHVDTLHRLIDDHNWYFDTVAILTPQEITYHDYVTLTNRSAGDAKRPRYNEKLNRWSIRFQRP